MTIKSPKLRDLFERYMNFINSNYIYAIVTETTNTVSIAYSGELARIFIKVDDQIGALVVKITQDPTRKMSADNGKSYYMATIDEMNNLISASKVIMDLKISGGGGAKLATEATEGQGFVLDANKNLIGVVLLNRIPTNAYVYDKTEITVDTDDLEEPAVEEPKEKRRSIRRFFS